MSDYQTCPKCGFRDWYGPVYEPNYKPQAAIGACAYWIEALVYRCKRCAYERTEEPLDRRNKQKGGGI